MFPNYIHGLKVIEAAYPQELVPVRTHKKWRTRKKWIKRYGYKTIIDKTEKGYLAFGDTLIATRGFIEALKSFSK